MLQVSQNGPFLIVPSVFSNFYFTLKLFIEVHVPGKESEWSCIFVLGVSCTKQGKWVVMYIFIRGIMYQVRKVSGHQGTKLTLVR